MVSLLSLIASGMANIVNKDTAQSCKIIFYDRSTSLKNDYWGRTPLSSNHVNITQRLNRHIRRQSRVALISSTGGFETSSSGEGKSGICK